MDRPVSIRGARVDLSRIDPFDIGHATIDPPAHEAIVSGRREHFQPQTLKVLVALYQRRGDVVGRDELIDRCWDGRIVGDDVINRCISILRRFSEKAGGFTIETVPKAGYRLLEGQCGPPVPGRGAWSVLFVAIAGIAAAMLWLWPKVDQGSPPRPTVAVLPIAAEPTDARTKALAGSTTDALLHFLAESGYVPQRLAALPANAGGRADFLISGTARHSGNGAEITVRLDETRNGMTILSKRLSASGSEVAMLSDRIAVQIAASLNWSGALMVLDRRRPLPPLATAELLRQLGIIVEGGDNLRAFEVSRRIASQAPDSAIAQVALAYNAAFSLDLLPRPQRVEALILARAAEKRARQLAPEFGDVFVPWCLLHSSVRLAECEKRMRHGLRADPDASFVAFFLANFLQGVGRNEEALKMARVAIADDPYKPAKLAAMIRLLEAAGDTNRAESLYARATHYWPDYQEFVWSRATGILQRGDFGALAQFHRARPGPMTRERRFALTLADAVVARDVAKTQAMCRDEKRPSNANILCLVALPGLGDTDGGMRHADILYPGRVGATPAEEDRLFIDDPVTPPNSLLTAPSAAALRRHPRFAELAGRIGLGDYWRLVALPDFCSVRPEPICSRLR